MISVKNLKKSFSVRVRGKGLSGSIKGLFKREQRIVEAVKDISFDISTGELVGYIGPNGAGKSTTIKILSGILVPDAGECTIAGYVPWKDRLHYVRNIGVVFGQRTQLWWDLPVIDSFNLLKDIYKLRAGDYRRKLDELIALIDLENFLDVPVRQLSLGQRMRCDLAASNIHSPKILFLDEPTIGLDAVSKLAIREFIKKINEENKTTIILTTHDMDDIEALAKRIMIIGKGEILFDGTITELNKKILHDKNLIIDLSDNTEFIEPEFTSLVEKNGNRIRLSYDPKIISTKTLINRIIEKYDIHDITVENPPIEKLIANLYKEYKI